MPVNPEWLKQVKEESLEPELRICDPHHHLTVSYTHQTLPTNREV